MSEGKLIVRESTISVAINMALSGVFFVAFFGTRGPHPATSMAADFVPQSFMVALMATLIPALLVGRKRGARPGPIAGRAMLFSVGAAVVGGGSLSLIFINSAATLSFQTALAFKIAYGGLLASIVTPPALLLLLRSNRESAR